MTLRKLIEQRRAEVLTYLRGYHGKSWKQIIKSKGFANVLNLSNIVNLDEYAIAKGYKPETYSFERTSTTETPDPLVLAVCRPDTCQCNVSHFETAEDLAQTLVSIDRKRKLMGFRVLEVEKKARFDRLAAEKSSGPVPGRGGVEGGQTGGPQSLSGPSAHKITLRGILAAINDTGLFFPWQT